MTDIPAKKQGAALVLALVGKDRDTALELKIEDINSERGFEMILEKLGGIYKKDTVDTAYENFEQFIRFKRELDMDIVTYITEFERRYSRAKEHGCILSSSVLAYFLLNQAGLKENEENIIKATINALDFVEMKTKLKKVFGKSESFKNETEMEIKVEEINLNEECDEEVLYGRYGPPRRRVPQAFRGNQRFFRGSTGFGRNRGSFGSSNKMIERKRIQYDERGNKMKCKICESILHQTYECPDKVYYAEDEESGNYDIVI